VRVGTILGWPRAPSNGGLVSTWKLTSETVKREFFDKLNDNRLSGMI
jgi:hypothetical protein